MGLKYEDLLKIRNDLRQEVDADPRKLKAIELQINRHETDVDQEFIH